MKGKLYWVTHSVEYRALQDKIHSDCRLNPIEWSGLAFIAQRGQEGACYDWLVVGTDMGYDLNDLVVVSGPIEPPRIGQQRAA